MKKVLFAITLFVLSTFAVNANPIILNGSVVFNQTMNNTYFIDYAQFVNPNGGTVLWGTGYIDLNTRTHRMDAMYETPNYEVKARERCDHLTFKPVLFGPNAGYYDYYLNYVVFDTNGLASNVGTIHVRIIANANSQSVQFDPCPPF